MIRKVVAILKRHLDYAEVDYHGMWEALEITPFDILREFPNYNELRKLAIELVKAIREEDISKLVKIPSQEEAEFIVEQIMPTNLGEKPDKEDISYHAKYLRARLADTGQFGERTLVSDVIRLRAETHRD